MRMRIGGAPRREDRDLLRRCERVLATAGRAAGAGSRQQVRAAARSFVRRHRRDGSYLAFVLRSVLANSAFAVALLGLAPTPADAATTLFIQKVGSDNPLDFANVGNLSTPAASDFDHDGDLDIVSGERNGTFFNFTNVGSATVPSYIIQPTIIVDVGDGSAPAFGDLDHDGDDDELVGTAAGTFAYFGNRNIFAPNPMNGVDVGSYATPAFADLDADGDLDLVVGEFDGVFNYFENIGGATAPQFAQHTDDTNPLNGQDVGLFSAPAIADFDGDGDLDLVSGAGDGTFFYFENTGSPRAPAFVLRTGSANPLNGFDVGGRSTPVRGDFDHDGDADLIVGNAYGSFAFFQNLAGTFAPQAANPLAGKDVGIDSAPTLGDLDADGDLDLLSGAFDGFFYYFKNIGTVLAPAFMEQTGTQDPLGNFGVGSRSKPVFADIGHFTPDGKLDVTSGANDGTFRFYQNTGTATAPAFLAQTGSQTNPFYNEDVGANSAPALGDLDGSRIKNVTGENFGTFLVSEPFGSFIATGWLDGQDVGFYSTPAFGDADGDGDLDLVAGEQAGVFNYFENVGTPLAPVFLLHSDGASPVAGQDVGFDSTPTLGDLDGDGDRDLVSGNYGGGFNYFKNVLIRPWPRYTGPIPIPFGSTNVGFVSSPAAGDLDGDGDPDFVASQSFGDGSIHYFKNTGSALQPKVLEQTGGANPFNTLSAGTTPRLAFGDIDHDGDLDLISGQNAGYYLATLFFENTGSATDPHFIARTNPADNPFNGVAAGRAAPALGDIDGDGDLDVVVGEFYGTFRFFKNVGTALDPMFLEQTGGANPFNGITVVNFATPALGDVDRDGDLDFLAGDEANGVFTYFENTGSATAPAFIARTGAANPLDGEDVGADSAPAFVDLDGDGDLDVVSGERYGTLPTYYLPEPGSTSLLAAGASLLAWLSRWRSRKKP